MGQYIRFKTSSPAGDLISYMAGIRQLCKETNQKAVIYQQLNVLGQQGDTPQPFTDKTGRSIMMGEEMFNNLKPLIEAQDYIESFEQYQGQEIDLDVDNIRQKIFVGQPTNSLNRYMFHAFPQMACDLTTPYLFVKDNEKCYSDNMVVLNFTFRYRNAYVNYFFLKKYQDKLLFVGLQNEYEYFCEQWNLDITHLSCNSFYTVAQVIKKSRFVLANQSVVFQIAEALKIPRMLEIFPAYNNVIPIGANTYDYYHQNECEYYFDKLINAK